MEVGCIVWEEKNVVWEKYSRYGNMYGVLEKHTNCVEGVCIHIK